MRTQANHSEQPNNFHTDQIRSIPQIIQPFGFTLTAVLEKARLGSLQTMHGSIATPCFMPVGTCGTVKAMKWQDILNTGSEIILGNTYHLYLRPGIEVIRIMGGLHSFTGWKRPILTDSGGFQVMSLSGLRKVSEDGVIFASHIDGRRIHFTPENVVETQYHLGSTISMVLDQCIAYPASLEEARKAMELSMRWAKRAKDAYIARQGYGLFGIVQGSTYESLRLESIAKLRDIGFDGYAVGGLAVGEGHDLMVKVLQYTAHRLPADKPRYLMGVGKPEDIWAAVKEGIDMFDCVLPTRSGRNGQAFTRDGTRNLRNSQYADDINPLDQWCRCYCCANHSRAYLHHLFRSKEILGAMLLTEHNIQYYQDLMAFIRKIIKCYGSLYSQQEERYLGYEDSVLIESISKHPTIDAIDINAINEMMKR